MSIQSQLDNLASLLTETKNIISEIKSITNNIGGNIPSTVPVAPGREADVASSSILDRMDITCGTTSGINDELKVLLNYLQETL